MKYILELTDKNPENNTTVTFNIAQDVIDFKKKAIEQGFKVTVKGEKHEERGPRRLSE